MISPSERTYIAKYAYVPEHLPEYVSAISQTEPFLINDFVVHVSAPHLILVGYPLKKQWVYSQIKKTLKEIDSRFKPESTSVITPKLFPNLKDFTSSPPDVYYRLDLTRLEIPKKTRNMLKRAKREVSISIGSYGKEHKKLIKAFTREHHFDRAMLFIFQRVSEYAKCDNVYIYDARNALGDLIAFDIADFWSATYVFYMFNFRSPKHNIPGVSDLLLGSIIERAKTEGKRYLNLGLGINPGIAFFKKKWGATPFLNYTALTQETPKQGTWWEVIDQLSK